MKSNNSSTSNSGEHANLDFMLYNKNYPNLIKSFNDICHIQHEYINFLNRSENLSDINIKVPTIDTILDAYALKVARKKDTYEKITTLEGICEGNEIFLIKRWKRKCRFLLEIIAELFYSYQRVNQMKRENCLNPTDIEAVSNYLKCIVSNESVNLTNSEFDKLDVYIEISRVFLYDFLRNFNSYRNELHQQLMIKDRLFHVLKKAKDQRAKLKIYVNKLRDEICYVQKKLKQSAELIKSKLTNNPTMESSDDLSTLLDDNTYCINHSDEATIDHYETKITELEKIIKEEERRRKLLHNKFQQLIGNTRVFCRIRSGKNCCLKLSNDDKLIVDLNTINPKLKPNPNTNNKGSYCFIFDRVFDSNSNCQEIFSNVDPLITSCVDGYNVAILAYGCNGSGKSYTMNGNGALDNEGLTVLSLRQLLLKTQARNQWQYNLSLSIAEIYEDEIFDMLLTPSVSVLTNNNTKTQVKLSVETNGKVTLNGLTEMNFDSELKVLELLKSGENNRKLGASLSYVSSSKSHYLIFVKICGVNINTANKSFGLLTLCDLAYSNNKPACVIYNSLISLNKIFEALRNNQKPSYNDNKLTYLLKPCLSGDSKSILIINVRAELEYVNETFNSLKFGENAMQVISNRH